MANRRMSRPNDARALRSRESLRSALLRLVEKRPFEEISIRDITHEAGVSYPVFYRRFSSKEELLADIATDEVRRLLTLVRQSPNDGYQDDGNIAMCNHVNEHRILWKNLLTTGAASAMRTEFIRIAKEISKTRERSNPWLPEDLAVSFAVSGIFEILAWWLNQPPDYPIQNIVKILHVLIVRSTARPVDISLI